MRLVRSTAVAAAVQLALVGAVLSASTVADAVPSQPGGSMGRGVDCDYACPLTRALLLCDVDGTWTVWLMTDQSVRVPRGACSREDLPAVFDRLGQAVDADVIVVGEDD